MEERVGFGYDIHRLQEGDSLILGGVKVPCEYSAVAHSDGDVVLHSLVDALLSSIGENDIGTFYPDDSEKTKDMDSSLMVKEVLSQVHNRGYRINNVVVVISLERPKLAGYKEKIRESLASLLSIGEDRISVHAKTGEKVGPVGREEAVESRCVLLVSKEGE